MLSINTNLSSLITQSSMNSATNKLNQAIERMTTGYKINCAKDNAAGYSIATNMTTKLGAYDVAADNLAMGMDLVTTASDTLSLMQDKAERLRALATQARNGTFGTQSLNAINTEANAIMAEINRIYSTAQYNGVSLYTGGTATANATPGVAMFAMARAGGGEPKFIENPMTYTDEQIAAMASIETFTDGASGKFKIDEADDLAYLATIVNDNQWNTANATFVLADNIDLTEWRATNGNWVPIGTDSSSFKGTFDGNGHVISNLTIGNPTLDYQGLFGYAGSNSTLKNVGLEGGSVTGQNIVGCLVGYVQGSITNCYVTGDVTGQGSVGGLVGSSQGSITNSYSTGTVTSTEDVAGGLVGGAQGSITNCHATGDVKGRVYIGGLVGSSQGSITNSYSTGDATGTNYVGGFAGVAVSSSITNCYTIGNATATNSAANFVSMIANNTTITNSFSTGISTNQNFVNYSINGNNISNCLNVESSLFGTEKTEAQILSASNLASMGFTEANGWTIVDGKPTIAKSFALTPSQSTPDSTPGGGTGGGGATGPVGVSLFILQIGINSDSSCQIGFDTNFTYDLSMVGVDISSDEALVTIDEFLNLLSEKQTMLGAVQNRLESVLEEITIQRENLVSSRSTIRDADIAKVSSKYIQQQILQQASATLLATANQSPSIALQLI